MKVFKQLKENFGGTIVHFDEDQWGEIYVIDRDHLRYLKFDYLYNQSVIDLETPEKLQQRYHQTMIKLLDFISPQHVTVLGVGGACLIHALHHRLPACQIHAVELREKIYSIAKNFFHLPITEKIHISIGDAASIIKKQSDESTDIIFSDLYNHLGMLSLQQQENFLIDCHRVLKQKGWLVINYEKKADEYEKFLKMLGNLFDDVITTPITEDSVVVFLRKHFY